MTTQITHLTRLLIVLLTLGWLTVGSVARGQQSALQQWVAHLEGQLPRAVADCTAARVAAFAKAADAIDKWAAQRTRYQPFPPQPQQVLDRVEELVTVQRQVDGFVEEVLRLRTKFAAAAPGSARRAAIRHYVRLAGTMIDLAGRTRFQLRGALDYASFRLGSQPKLRERMIDLLTERNSGIGAAVMALSLFDPAPDARKRGAVPATPAMKAKILALIARTGEVSQVAQLARYVRRKDTPADLLILAADTLRRIGLPQDERPGQDKDLPKPEITATQLHEIVAAVDASKLSAELGRKRQGLLTWLDGRKARGLEGETYRMGNFDVRPGDWMLMRNPSPYNLFTDLSPGLFTHVGIVALETGSDGRRRMVVVDLPERGRQIPATNIEIYVQRSLHYMFVRHPETTVSRKLAEVATTIIGNESGFDLNFRTDRVLKLKGKPLKGLKIETYCAGLLLLSAQETERPREAFFPIPEGPSGGNTSANISKMGFSIGEGFISPTGAIFSPELVIVGRRMPMYDPVREIEEAVFDHFAVGLVHKTYVPSRTLAQDLLVKLAEYAKGNPKLAAAIRKKENIGDAMDLVAAAKAKAVVETLDEVAYGQSREFLDARRALITPNLDNLIEQGVSAEQIARLKQLRQKHDNLYRQLRQLTPRQLRVRLVDYYVTRGKAEIDRRFFGQ